MSINSTINFVTLADDNFIKPLTVSAKQIATLYPDSAFHVYDQGISPNNQLKLEALCPNIVFTEWKNYHHPVRLKGTTKTRLLKLAGLTLDLVTSSDKKAYTQLRKYDLEIQYLNKIYFLEDFCQKTNDPFVYLDADAFLLKNIDELFTGHSDIMVTVRKRDELSYEKNNCKLLNAGVIFFTGKIENSLRFIRAWKKRAHETSEYLAEQSALSRMILDKDAHFFEEIGRETTVEGVRVKGLSCEQYNYNWLEDFERDKQSIDIKIMHLKSGRFNSPLFEKLNI